MCYSCTKLLGVKHNNASLVEYSSPAPQQQINCILRDSVYIYIKLKTVTTFRLACKQEYNK